jgi:hypothetical protein
MTSVISASPTANNYSSLFAASAVPNWLNDTMVAIQNSATTGGILGALGSTSDGSVASFLGQSSTSANNFALISQNSVTNASAFYAQIASQNLQKRQQDKLQQSLADLNRSQNQVQPKNINPFVYLADGSTIDTETNIMTRADGTQYDITTGAKYIDPADVIQMANGAYLNTQTNILTLADGTQIDTVTGLKVSTSA